MFYYTTATDGFFYMYFYHEFTFVTFFFCFDAPGTKVRALSEACVPLSIRLSTACIYFKNGAFCSRGYYRTLIRNPMMKVEISS